MKIENNISKMRFKNRNGTVFKRCMFFDILLSEVYNFKDYIKEIWLRIGTKEPTHTNFIKWKKMCAYFPQEEMGSSAEEYGFFIQAKRLLHGFALGTQLGNILLKSLFHYVSDHFNLGVQHDRWTKNCQKILNADCQSRICFAVNVLYRDYPKRLER